MNPYAAPSDATDDQQRLSQLGRNDCPKCSTAQQRFRFINPRHKCRACGSPLKLRLSKQISAAVMIVAVLLFWLISAYYDPKIPIFLSNVIPASFRPAMSLVRTFIFFVVFHEVAKLAIGRPYVYSPDSKQTSRQRSRQRAFNALRIAVSFCLFLATLCFVFVFGSVMPIVVVCVCCAVIYMASTLLFGRSTAKGHLEMPPSLQRSQPTLLWAVAAVAMGAVIGTLLSP